MLGRLGGGIGSVALLDLLNRKGLLAAEREKNPLAAKPKMLPAKAKAVISIFCYGGVSQVDTFDPKPELLKRQGERMTGVGEVVATMGTPGGLMPSPWSFKNTANAVWRSRNCSPTWRSTPTISRSSAP